MVNERKLTRERSEKSAASFIVGNASCKSSLTIVRDDMRG